MLLATFYSTKYASLESKTPWLSRSRSRLIVRDCGRMDTTLLEAGQVGGRFKLSFDITRGGFRNVFYSEDFFEQWDPNFVSYLVYVYSVKPREAWGLLFMDFPSRWHLKMTHCTKKCGRQTLGEARPACLETGRCRCGLINCLAPRSTHGGNWYCRKPKRPIGKWPNFGITRYHLRYSRESAFLT